MWFASTMAMTQVASTPLMHRNVVFECDVCDFYFVKEKQQKYSKYTWHFRACLATVPVCSC